MNAEYSHYKEKGRYIMRNFGTCTAHKILRWKRRNVYRILVGRPEGKTPLGRPRRRWAYNLTTNH